MANALITSQISPVQFNSSNEPRHQFIDQAIETQQQPVEGRERDEDKKGKPFVYVSRPTSSSFLLLIKVAQTVEPSLQYEIKGCRISTSTDFTQNLRPPLGQCDSDSSLSDISNLSLVSLGSSSTNTSFCSDTDLEYIYSLEVSSPITKLTDSEIDRRRHTPDGFKCRKLSSPPSYDSFSDDVSFCTDDITDGENNWESCCDAEVSLDPDDFEPQPGVRECGLLLTPIPEHSAVDDFVYDPESEGV